MMSRRYYEWSMLVLRVALGAIFLAHGLQKVAGFAGVVKFFSSIGMPLIMVYVVVAIEAVGGAFLILGIFTRTTAAGLIAVMLGSIFTVQLNKGFINGYEFNVSLLAMAVALFFSGSNIFSLGNVLRSLLGAAPKNKAT